MSKTEWLPLSSVVLGDLNLIGKFEGNLAGAALLVAVRQEHLGTVAIRMDFEKFGDSAEMCIGLDGEDL